MSRGSFQSQGSQQSRGSGYGLNSFPSIKRWREAGKREKALYCDCGIEADCWTSWTGENPGRRFRSCSTGSCHYWSWNDAPMCNIAKQLIPLLRDELIELRKDKAIKNKLIDSYEDEIRRCKAEITQLKEANRKMKESGKG